MGTQPRISSTPPTAELKNPIIEHKKHQDVAAALVVPLRAASAEIPSCSEGTMALQPLSLSQLHSPRASNFHFRVHEKLLSGSDSRGSTGGLVSSRFI